MCSNYGAIHWMASEKIRWYILYKLLFWSTFSFAFSDIPELNKFDAALSQKTIIRDSISMLVMFFSTSTTLLTNYLSVILEVDTTQYLFCIFLLPGYVLGAFIVFGELSLQCLALPFF